MSIKVRFYSYDIEFEFENSVEFPVAPQVGDEVNLISFFKYQTSERIEYYENMEDLGLYNNALVIERTWHNDLEKNEIYLLVQLKYKRR
ncbi:MULTISPECIES: hypothetical protein [Chryseobacterium]|nr:MULTISPECIES: hypothetical protein [Chryseobacterium]MDQ8142816.1 hypothetical protein [Chryseobacterium sp. CFS15]QQQ27420.1 hypothetical protein JJL46_15025 [Chryseobacterium indoltheticum]SIR08178.1 hypothetical protein SAMN05421682_11229 [Chryseobacterium indoltheticum]SUX41797.1 Uncharacterised protein [Chryseobacterium indoltheticum]SUX47621.1 Uncharacterised protein [Chryseobacterium indoltheticum]